MNCVPRSVLALLLIVSACDRERDLGHSAETAGHAAESVAGPADSTVSAAGAPAAPAAVDTSPNGEPAHDSPEAAVAVVNGYYDALQGRDFNTAYRYWVDEGAGSKQTFDEFRRGFSETSWVDVDTGQPGDVEGAAGSRFVTVPVVVSAGGSHGAVLQCFTGTYTLVHSEVTGATEAERHWHIHSADLEPCVTSRGSR